MKTISPSQQSTAEDTIIDRPIWHNQDPSYPSHLPPENASTHIGMYLAWGIINKLASNSLAEDHPQQIEKLKTRQITGRQFLAEYCDDIFMLADFSPEGQSFTKAYYQPTYFNQFVETFAREKTAPFEVEDNWANYDLIADTLCEAYKNWKAPSLVAAYKQWWQFWR